MKELDVVIIGAGPAGSVCGSLLKRAGVDCVIIDHADFPRDKVCGGVLSPKAWHLLENLFPDIQYNYKAMTHITLDIDGKAHCQFDMKEPARLVSRKSFDHALLKYYQSLGGAFMKGSFQTVEETDSQLIVTLKSGERIACRYLVGADGSNSAVRRYLTPKQGFRVLAMEQYVPKAERESLDLGLSQSYGTGGYFYRFSSIDHDIVGFGDNETTPERYRQVMREKGIPVDKPRGAYISLSTDYPLNDRIILIGDAGGFANRITCEGLYDAMQTASNAVKAITTGTPFREVNAQVFSKIRTQEKFAHFFFSKFSFFVMRLMCKAPNFLKWCVDTKMRRETFIKK